LLDLFGQTKTITIYNTATIFNNFTITQTPSKEYVTITSIPVNEYATVTATKVPPEEAAEVLTKSEIVMVTVSSLQPVTVTKTISVTPLALFTTQTSPTLSAPSALNILSIILQVIQDLESNKQLNPIVELIKLVTQQAAKLNHEKIIQAVMSFVFNLIQKSSSQNNINPFPSTRNVMSKDAFEDQIKKWFKSQLEAII
jgi:hypothetical protein